MVAGYLRQIDVDFGDRVKKGEVIAVLDAPELSDELAHAIAARQRAIAANADAHLEFTRLEGVNKSQPNLISAQDLDTAEAKDRTSAAEVAAAEADAAKYRALLEYTKITAPFDGVITRRYVDPGALIQPGSSQSQPLVRISENQLLRLDFPVSISYIGDIVLNEAVDIRIDGVSRPLSARISRFSRRIDMETRTMETEAEVANGDLKLIPGMYATVVLKVHRRPGALAVPVEAVASSGNPTVYLVSSNGEVSERSVKLGIETPNSFEVLGGLASGDLVIVSGRASVHPGEKVNAKIVETPASP